MQDVHQRAQPGEGALEQVEADEAGHPQEVLADEQRRGFDAEREKWEQEYAAAQARWEAHKAQVVKAAEAEAAAGDDFGGQSFTSEAAGAGTLADDEALAALREKLSGGNA